jgi:hypothetical protein
MTTDIWRIEKNRLATRLTAIPHVATRYISLGEYLKRPKRGFCYHRCLIEAGIASQVIAE